MPPSIPVERYSNPSIDETQLKPTTPNQVLLTYASTAMSFLLHLYRSTQCTTVLRANTSEAIAKADNVATGIDFECIIEAVIVGEQGLLVAFIELDEYVRKQAAASPLNAGWRVAYRDAL